MVAQSPSKMKAVFIEEFGDDSKLKYADLPTPKPQDNEVLIEVKYASVNPVDWKIEEGFLKKMLPHEFPLVLGWDAAGVVSSVGKNVRNLKVGDEVYAYCRKPTVKEGTFAEYVRFDAENVALKPNNISFAQAASIPLAGLTAWQAIFDNAKPKKGDSILILGGSGGVGSFAIQFAKQAGCKIFTTASQKNHDYVKKLGAHTPIDYTKENVSEKIKPECPQGVDIILDLVGGDSLAKSLTCLKPNGKLISIVNPHPDPSLLKSKNIQFHYAFVTPNGKQLKQIAELITSNKLVLPALEEIPMKETAKAFQKSREGHTRGKIVLRIK